MSGPLRSIDRAVRALALAAACAGASWFAAPALFPARLYEGPYVQNVTADSAVVAWYLTRPAECRLYWTAADGEREATVQRDGRRCRAMLTGLRSDSPAPYRIAIADRTVATAATRASPPRTQPARIIVFGDSGRGTQAQFRLAARMRDWPSDAIVHTGDVVYPGGERRHYEARLFAPYRELMRNIALWPTLGNHDVTKSGEALAYCEVFELPQNGPDGLPPEYNYWFDIGPARFVMIDSNVDEATLAGRTAPWIGRAFAECDAAWRIAVFHHPPYTAGSYTPDGRLQRAIVPALEAAGVDFVFSGHDHLYQRMRPLRRDEIDEAAGITYVVSGAGGAKLYKAQPPESRPGYVAALENTRHGFTYVEIEPGELQLRQIDIDGREVDRYRRSKPAATTAPTPATP